MDVEQDAYVASYENLEVHELMLKDQSRVLAYKNFIDNNSHLFKDKTVVDVGAGTGILSLLAARAGAKKVYAIEASKVSHLCQQIVEKNGMSDRIVVMHGKVEDVHLPELEKNADVIISEWMGFYLLHESMLASVLKARDKFLSTNGVILPSSCTLSACPTSLQSRYKQATSFWKNVHGFDFTPAIEETIKSMTHLPQVIALNEEDLLSQPITVLNMDMMHADEEDVKQIISNLNFSINKNGVLRGVALWFDAIFGEEDISPENRSNDKLTTSNVLSTHPTCPETHWKQTVVVLPTAYLVNAGSTFECKLQLARDEINPRRYNITIELTEEESDDDDMNDEFSDDDMNVGCDETNSNFQNDTNIEELIKSHMH